MNRFISILYDYIVEYLVRIIGVCLFVTVLLQIFTRIFFKIPFSFTDELARFLFIWYCFMGSVLTMYKKMHLGIDYFESKMSDKHKKINRYFIYFVELLFGFVITYFGFKLLNIVGIQKSPVMRMKMVYAYVVLPISGVLYIILAINELKNHFEKNRKSSLEVIK